MTPSALSTTDTCAAARGIELHDHVCLIYSNEAERLAAEVPFFKAGLVAGERCIAIADAEAAQALLRALADAGLDSNAALARGALVLLDQRNGYLRGGRFDPDDMRDLLEQACAAAEEAGFSGLRVAGEMSWVLGEEPGVERFLEYEAGLAEFFATHPIAAICEYDRRRFPAELLHEAVHAHPLVMIDGVVCENHLHIPPEALLDSNAVARRLERALRVLRERTQIEAALQVSEQHARALAEQSPAGIYLTDAAGQCLYVNPRWCEMAGLSPAEAAGDGWRRALHPEDRKRIAAEWYAAAREGGRWQREYRFQAPDGRVTWILGTATALRDPVGRVTGYLGTNIDITARKQAEIEVARAREEWERTFDAVPDLVALIDDQFTVTRVNRAMAARLGCAPEACVGRKCYELVHGTSAPPPDCPHVRLLADGREHCTVAEEPRLGGEFEISVSPRHDAAGRLVGSVHVARDVTAARRAEAELRAREKELQLTLEATTDAIWKWDLKTGQMSFSPRYYRMLGFEPDEFPATYEAWLDLIHPDDRAQALRVSEEYLATKPDRYENEFRLRTKAGGYRWILACGTVVERDADGAAVRMIGNHEDVTERRQAEEALRASREQYRQLVELAQEGIWALDTEARTTFVNPRMAAMLGYTAAEMQGRALFDFMDEQQVAAARAAFARRQAGVAEHHDFEFRRKDGTLVHTSLAAGPLCDATGRFAGAFAVISDVTDRRQAEAALRASEEAVQRKLRALLEPAGDLGVLELADVLNCTAIQSLLDEFYRLTRIGVGIIDMQGRILVATGWQEICTQFHRAHPETHAACLESDLELSRGVAAGEFKLYRCRNNMWDMATPLIIGGRHVGNLFLGQFFFEDEQPDYETFRAMARQYGFDEAEYLAALDRVPRWSRETVETVMRFYAKLAQTIADLSYGNLRLARTLAEREELVAQLQESRLQQEAAARAGNVGLWDWDLRTNKVHYSAEWKRQIGHAEDEVSDEFDEWQSRVHPDDLDATLAHVRQSIAEARDHWQVEFRFRHKDGSYRWILAQAAVLMDEAGRPVRALGSHVDLTDRRQAEQALRESQVLLKATGRVARVGGWQLDAQSMTVHWTEETCRIHEVPLDYQPTLDEALAFFHPEDRETLAAAVRRALDRGEPYDLELRFITAKGRHLWTHTRCEPQVVDGQTVRLVGTFQDITGRRQAEQALRESEEKYRQIVELANEGIWAIDPQNVITYANQRMAEVLGYRTDEMLGCLVTAYMFPEDLPDHAARMAERRAGRSGRYERRFRHRAGHAIHTLVSATPLLDADGAFAGSFAMFTDVTAQRQAEDQLRHAQRMEVAGTLAAGVAHDLNNVLTAIMGHAECARQACGDRPGLAAEMGGVLKAAEQAAGVTRALLTFSRRMPTRLSPLRLEVITADGVRMLRRMLPASIEIVADVPKSDELWLAGDAVQLNQVLMNLVVNARDALPAGGRLEVRLRTHHATGAGEWWAAADRGDGAAMLTVADDGVGMPSDVLARVCEPFFTTKPRGQGTGLGLAIVHGIVTAHGGALQIESQPGQGTRVHVALPLTPPVPQRAAATPAGAVVGRGETILVAEDNGPVRAVMAAALDAAGYAVVQAADGAQALALLCQPGAAFKLALLDVDMPKVSGVSVARHLRGSGNAIPIILASGLPCPSSEGRLGENVSFLPKPFQLPDLVRTVADMVSKFHPAQEPEGAADQGHAG